MHPSLPRLASAAASWASVPFKRSKLGLFHGQVKSTGNNVPHSKGKTRRTWLPNIQSKRLVSDALGETVRVKLTTKALKTIKKYGGLDQYVLKTKTDLLGWEGMRLRVAVRAALEAKEEKRAEEDALAEAVAPVEPKEVLVADGVPTPAPAVSSVSAP